METYQVIALGLTLGLTLVCFIAWVWQMMVKRRRLEDDVERMKDELGAGDSDAAGTANAPDDNAKER